MKNQEFVQPNTNPYVLKKYGYDIAVTNAVDSFDADGVQMNYGESNLHFDPPLLVRGKITNIGNVGNSSNGSSNYLAKLYYYYTPNEQVAGQEPVFRTPESGVYWTESSYGGRYLYPTNTGQLVSLQQDFTFEFFLKTPTLNESRGFIGFGYPNYYMKNWNIQSSAGGLDFYWADGSSNYTLDLVNGVDALADFGHIAVVRKNGVLKSFFNGSLVATNSGPEANTNFDATGSDFSIGSANGPSYVAGSNSFFSNMRYVVGTALYDSNFTVPSIPLREVNGLQTRILLTGNATVNYTQWDSAFQSDPNSSGQGIIIFEPNDYT